MDENVVTSPVDRELPTRSDQYHNVHSDPEIPAKRLADYLVKYPRNASVAPTIRWLAE